MALPVYRYPLDKTGENPDNHVLNEPHSLTPKTRPTDVRVAAPLYGPFFSESVRVIDKANGITLVKGSDYKVTDLLQDPTLDFGKEIGQFIVITNGSVSNEIAVSYQVLGGNYQNDATAVQHVFETFLNDTRPVDWTNISGKPSTFPPSLHIHLLEDIIGWAPVIVALDRVADAILLHNTPMFEALIDWVTTRKFKWSDLTGTPTTLAGYGITDAVHNTRSILTPSNSGLKGGGDLTVNRSLSLTDTGVVVGTYGTTSQIAQVTVDAQGRVTKAGQVTVAAPWNGITGKPTTLAGYGITDAVSKSFQINTPFDGGIEGGGSLQSNLTLKLRTSGVVAGTYGDYNKIPIITIDTFGRVTSINSFTIEPPSWNSITDKPTTLAGYGITDGALNTRRINTVAGSGLQGGGDLKSDRSLSLTDTGVAAGTYGSASVVPVITIDTKGRITKTAAATIAAPWNGITGKPTTLAGYGITDGALRTRKINTVSGSGLQGGGDLSADRSLSLTDTGVTASTYGTSSSIPVITVDAKGRITKVAAAAVAASWNGITGKPTTLAGYGITDAVHRTRLISTSSTTGLLGGGPLSSDLTLSLSDSGVSPITIDSASLTPVITVDRYGRVTRLSSKTINVSWPNILNKPTTLSGYGITDGVAVSRQILTPAAGGLQGGGALSANLSLSLANSGAAAGTYGTESSIPVVTVDSKGRITKISAVSPVVKTEDTGSIKLSGNGSTTPLSADVKLSPRPGNRIQVTADGIGVFDSAPPDIAVQYIDAVNGNDSNPGTMTSPLRTFFRAIQNIYNAGGGGDYRVNLKANQTHAITQELPHTTNADITILPYGDPKYKHDVITVPPGYYWQFAPDLQRPTLDFRLVVHDVAHNYTILPTLSAASIVSMGIRIRFPTESKTYPGAATYAFSTETTDGRLWLSGCDIIYRATNASNSIFRGGKFVWQDCYLYGFSGQHRLGDSTSTYIVGDNAFTLFYPGDANFPSFYGRETNLYKNLRYYNLDQTIQGVPEYRSLFGGTINIDIFSLG